MLTNEVKQITGLTRKALLYYEEQGLVHPKVRQENGYRDYSQEDVVQLTRIAILRQIGLPVTEIRQILEDPVQWDAVLEAHVERLSEQIAGLERSVSALQSVLNPEHDASGEDYDWIQRLGSLRQSLEWDAMQRQDYMLEQLIRLFPGKMGRLMAARYGPFLDEPLDTEEKRQAWLAMVEYLDENDGCLDLQMGDQELDDAVIDQLAEAERQRVEEIMNLTPAYVEKLRQDLQRQAQARAASPELQQAWEQVQAQNAENRRRLTENGYYQRLYENLKVVSPKYQVYLANLEQLGRELGIE